MSARNRSIRIGEHSVRLSNPDKVLFPESGLSKRTYVEYYARVAPYMLSHVRGRPISMERFPDGVAGERFYQKEAPDYFPDFVDRVPIESEDGPTKPYAVLENEAAIVYLANQVTIIHIWSSRADALRHPDRMVWDLDPMGLGFDKVKIAAKLLRYLLGELGVPCWPMLTGSRGLHVVTFVEPKYEVGTVFQFTKEVAQLIARKLPQVFTAEYSKSRRGKKIYVDYHRNVHAQTAVAPYAVRAIEGAPVAMPITWEDVDDDELQAQSYPIERALRRLEDRGESWDAVESVADFAGARSRLAELMESSRIVHG